MIEYRKQTRVLYEKFIMLIVNFDAICSFCERVLLSFFIGGKRPVEPQYKLG